MYSNKITGKISNFSCERNKGNTSGPLLHYCKKCMVPVKTLQEEIFNKYFRKHHNYQENINVVRDNLLYTFNSKYEISFIDLKKKSIIFEGKIYGLVNVNDYFIYGNCILFPDNTVKEIPDLCDIGGQVFLTDKYVIFGNQSSTKCLIFNHKLELLHKFIGELSCVCNDEIWPIWSVEISNGQYTNQKQIYYSPKKKENILEITSRCPIFLAWNGNEAIEMNYTGNERLQGDYCIPEDQVKNCFISFREFKRAEPKIEDECCICFNHNDTRTALAPCGHSFFCEKCALDIVKSLKKCPFCEKIPSGSLRLF